MVGYPQSRSKKTQPTALPSTTFISGELHVTTCLPKFVPRPGPTCQCAPRSCHFCLNYWWTRKLTWVLVVVIFSSSFTGKKHEETWSLSPGGYLISITILSFEFEKTSAAMSGCYKLVLTPHSSHLAAPGFLFASSRTIVYRTVTVVSRFFL